MGAVVIGNVLVGEGVLERLVLLLDVVEDVVVVSPLVSSEVVVESDVTIAVVGVDVVVDVSEDMLVVLVLDVVSSVAVARSLAGISDKFSFIEIHNSFERQSITLKVPSMLGKSGTLTSRVDRYR